MPKINSANWMTNSAVRHAGRGSKSWKKRIRTCVRRRLARIQPNTASQIIRKRAISSVQINGSPQARVTTPSVTQHNSATTRTHASASIARSRAVTARCIMTMVFVDVRRSSHRGDAFPETLAPFGFELGRHARQHGLLETFEVGLYHRHAAGLERVDQFGFLADDFVVLPQAVLGERLGQAASFLVVEAFPRRLVHRDQAWRDDMPGQHQKFL